MEGVPGGTPWPPDQPAQGLSTGLPLPQLCMVQGATKSAPLAGGVSSSHREPQVGSGEAGTLRELGTCKHTCEQGGAVNIRQEEAASRAGPGSLGSLGQESSQTHTDRGRSQSLKTHGRRACDQRTGGLW